MERLIIIENGEEIVFNIESRVVTIGRSSKNDIPIKDRNASRRHCNIIKVGESWFAVDCDSQNGTMVNQQPIKKQELEDGDKITVGAAEMIFMVAQEKPLQTEESMTAKSPVKKHPLQDQDLQDDRQSTPLPVHPKEVQVQKEDVPPQMPPQKPQSKIDSPPPAPSVSTNPPVPPSAPSFVPSSPPPIPKESSEGPEIPEKGTPENRPAEIRNRRAQTAAKQVDELYKSYTNLFAKYVVGYDYVAKLMFMALMNNEHCILTGPPGTGKLFMVRTVSESLGLSLQRISNVGIENYITNSNHYDLENLFGSNLNFLDHNFQAPTDTLTLVFDFLQNQKVPTERKTSSFQQVNTIVACNLPGKQTSSQIMQYKDAFMFDIPLDYLKMDLEAKILQQNIQPTNRAKKPMNFTKYFSYFQMLMANSNVSSQVMKFITKIVHHSRPYQSQCEEVKNYLLYGCGRKAALALLKAGQTNALLDSRTEVTMEDIVQLSYYVLHHRIALNDEGKKAKKSKKQIIESLLKFAKEN